MAISERRLKKWRKETLVLLKNNEKSLNISIHNIKEICNISLAMNQELLDQHLLKKE